MPRRSVLLLATAALLLEALPLVVAHGDDHGHASQESGHGDMNMHDAPKPQTPPNTDVPQSYWSLSEHASLMYMHIALSVLAWFFVLPIGVMLSAARSRFALFVQCAFLAVNAFAVLLGVVYSRSTPDLYENNAHGKIGWIFTWVASGWLLMAVVQRYAGRNKPSAIDFEARQPMTAANMAQYERVHNSELPNPSRFSNDSGQGTEPNSSSLFGHSRSPSCESEDQQFLGPTRRYTEEEETFRAEAEKRGILQGTAVDRFLSRNVARYVSGRVSKFIRILYVVLERTILLMGLIALLTGTVVYGGIGRGNAVFNVLAHYIKGGIFFVYGLLTLGRWMGAFANWGWAWNVKPPKEVVGRRSAAIPSAEFTESFVIFLYGCINVFLEHLAAWGGAWAPQDLEHVSISVLFFGGGLLGMIVESRRMRELLNTSVLASQPAAQYNDERWQEPRQYGFSMNPMPALVILLLGKMMSSHHQASMLSTMIHTQWGSMFMGFALARAFTYVIMYIRQPTSYLPSRPPTEIITSFCLVAGGITFIVSNKDTVAALESYGLDAMFTFTVTMGLTAVLLAWETVLIAIKGWAVRREHASTSSKIRNGVLA